MNETIIKKIENVQSVLLLVHNDLGNPEGAVLESHMQNVIDMAMDSLEDIINCIK